MATIKITKNNFEQEVINSKEPVILDFWASWCGPCRMVAPTLDEISSEMEGMAKVGKINVDEETELASQFRIMSIPTLMVVKNGKIAAQAVGVRPKKDILRMLEKLEYTIHEQAILIHEKERVLCVITISSTDVSIAAISSE